MKLVIYFFIFSAIALNAKEVQIYDKTFNLEEVYQSQLRVLHSGHCNDYERFKRSWEKHFHFCQKEQSSCRFLHNSVLDYEQSVPMFQGIVEVEDFVLQREKDFQVELSKNAFLESVDLDFSQSDLFSFLSSSLDTGLEKRSSHFLTKSRVVSCALNSGDLFLKGKVNVLLKAKKNYSKKIIDEVFLTHKTLKEKVGSKLQTEEMTSFFFGFLIGQILRESKLFNKVSSLFERYWIDQKEVREEYFQVSDRELMEIMFPEKVQEKNVELDWEGK